MSYIVKLAETKQEYIGIRRLNHGAFARELGQHETTLDGLLVDRFEYKSRYIIAVHGGEVVGMVAIHDQPPFSIAQRLADPSLLERIPGRKLEVRLLAIEPAHRKRMLFAALLCTLVDLATGEGYEMLLISGIVERASIYRRFGFSPLGPSVPSGKACYIPMVLRIEELPERIRKDIEHWRRRSSALRQKF